MLYDILPPLIFFVSFGGIILVVSRIVMRVRREDFSHAVHVEARQSSGVLPEQLLHSGKSGVELLKNPFSALTTNVRESMSATKSYWQTRKERKAQRQQLAEIAQEREAEIEEEKIEEIQEEEPSTGGISIPTTSWREKTAGLLRRTSSSMKAATERVRTKASTVMPQTKTRGIELSQSKPVAAAVPMKKVDAAPQIRIIRVEKPVAAEKQVVPEKPQEAPVEETTSPAGRFIARLKKSEPPKPSTLTSAQNALEAGNFDKAEELLVPYIIDHSRDCQAYILLGKVAAAKSSWDEAMEIYEQAVRIDPEKVDAQAGLGHAALQQGKFTIALRALQRAHSADPSDIHILHQILEIARRLDNKVLQKSTLEQLVELEPKDENISQALAALKAKEKARS